MLAVLQFVFSSFWVWLGTVILLGTIGKCITMMLIGLAALIHPQHPRSNLPPMEPIKPGSTGPKPSY